jgi:hypothetical protein
VDQHIYVLLKMTLDLFETARVHKIVSIYKRQKVDSVLNYIGGPVAIGAGTRRSGGVLEHDGERTGRQGRQGRRFGDSDRDNVGFACLSFQAFETGCQKGEMLGDDRDTDADAHY